jgi:hypothetical protein
MTLSRAFLLQSLTNELSIGPVSADLISLSFSRIGISVSSERILSTLREAGYYFNPTANSYEISNYNAPRWSYDTLQDYLSSAGYQGQDLYAAWSAVRAHIYIRWGRKNYHEPGRGIVLRWARKALEVRKAA